MQSSPLTPDALQIYSDAAVSPFLAAGHEPSAYLGLPTPLALRLARSCTAHHATRPTRLHLSFSFALPFRLRDDLQRCSRSSADASGAFTSSSKRGSIYQQEAQEATELRFLQATTSALHACGTAGKLSEVHGEGDCVSTAREGWSGTVGEGPSKGKLD